MDKDQRCSGLTKLGFGVLAYNSRDDAGAVAFLLFAGAALVLLFVCLREFERRRRAGGAAVGSGRIKAAVWALTALITGMFAYASMAAPLLPPLVVVGAIVVLFLRESERAQIGLGGRYADLVRMALGVVACDSALAHHHQARGDAGSLVVFVFVAYAGFLTLTWLFLRRFDGRARGAGH